MSTVPADNVLAFTDQLLFLGQRATGQELVMQVAWVYERAVDLDGLARFQSRFGHGVMGRRIERSPLWFGRHRWVAATEPDVDIEIATQSRPRTALGDWFDECARAPIDAEWGPCWRLAVLPLTDGATAVSLVMSHCVSDGMGALMTIAQAVDGEVQQFGYPQPRSRTRGQAVAADLRQAVRDLPEVAKTLVAGVGMAVRRRQEITGSKPPAASPAADRDVVVPAVTAHVDLDEWDARAAALGGTSYALVSGFAAKVAERIGRRRPGDGAVTLQLPISDRGPDDTRANAAQLAYATVDPEPVTSDLTGVRQSIRTAFAALKDEPDETLQMLPLTPYLPKGAVRRGSDVVFSLADLPVSCSNLGDVASSVAAVDGTEADYVMFRGVDRRVTHRFLEDRRGLLTVLAGRCAGRIALAVVAYPPGGDFTKADLRDLVKDTLEEFGITGVIDFVK